MVGDASSENVPPSGFLLRRYLRLDQATEMGVYQPRRVRELWRSLPLGVGEIAHQLVGGQIVKGGRRGGTAAPHTYCDRDFDDSDGDSGDGHAHVRTPCVPSGLMHARYVLERAQRLASGYAKPRAWIACYAEWPMESRPPHPAEVTRGLAMPQPGGR